MGVRFGAEAKNGGEGCRADPRGKIEKTLIEPQTRDAFKRYEGGAFGPGKWRVSEIRANAVWF